MEVTSIASAKPELYHSALILWFCETHATCFGAQARRTRERLGRVHERVDVPVHIRCDQPVNERERNRKPSAPRLP